MKQKRKNRFFTFIFSCLPGAAEMYMGFMKNGLTLMIFFFLSFVPIVFFSSFEFLMALGLVIWFFGFFHARNYASMTDAEFEAMDNDKDLNVRDNKKHISDEENEKLKPNNHLNFWLVVSFIALVIVVAVNFMIDHNIRI